MFGEAHIRGSDMSVGSSAKLGSKEPPDLIETHDWAVLLGCEVSIRFEGSVEVSLATIVDCVVSIGDTLLSGKFSSGIASTCSSLADAG